MKIFANRQTLLFFLVSLLTLAGQSQPAPMIDSWPEHLFSPTTTGPVTQKIRDAVAGSKCAKNDWSDRGQAPQGYSKGVALAFARSLCRLRVAPSAISTLQAEANTKSSSHDAVAYFQSTFSKNKMKTDQAGADTLRAVYTLGLGLGMRESSGLYCEGWDTSAGSNRPSSAAEAGAFQTSYDSISADPALKTLYKEYQDHPSRCFLDVFKEGASCKTQHVLGTGAGATFQSFNKSCPAFATEYAMTLLRVLRSHFGPINRKEAEIIPACYTLLKSVQTLIDQDPKVACSEFFP